MAITIGVFFFYIKVLSKQKEVLHEQKWVVIYFILLIFIQNPVSIVINFYDNPTPEAAFGSFILDYMGAAGQFVIWLLFADGVYREFRGIYLFYIPKIIIGIVIFAVALSLLIYEFPKVNPTIPASNQHTPLEAVYNWPDELTQKYIVLSIMYLCLLWLWVLIWFYTLFNSRRTLLKLPYMSTRYVQLSFRYVFIQAAFVTIYYFAQYAFVIYLILIATGNYWNGNNVVIADSINLLFRVQTQLFGRNVFLTVYAILLAFLFLPANSTNHKNEGIMALLVSTYTISEAEHFKLVKFRKAEEMKMKRKLQLLQLKMKTDVFCVEMALMVRDLAFQAYYDPVDLKTLSGYGRMDIEVLGFTMIDLYYEKVNELFCFIARENSTRRIIISFRLYAIIYYTMI